MKKVLVVDDEPGLRQSLGLLLTDAGYTVTAEQTAGGGSTAPSPRHSTSCSATFACLKWTV